MHTQGVGSAMDHGISLLEAEVASHVILSRVMPSFRLRRQGDRQRQAKRQSALCSRPHRAPALPSTIPHHIEHRQCRGGTGAVSGAIGRVSYKMKEPAPIEGISLTWIEKSAVPSAFTSA